MRAVLPWSVLLVLSVGACASGVGSDHDAGTTPPRDLGSRDGAVRDADASRDATVDMPPPDLCAGATCAAFEYCFAGTCRAYPACTPIGTCPSAADICRNRYCVPRTSDVDGDGVTADTDCDETNPDIHPGAADTCNGLDDDCSGTVDDGPLSALCAPGTGVCTAGACGCPAGFFDVDALPETGCECAASPLDGVAGDCSAPQDLGDIADTNQVQTVTGNVLPATREVWYRFRGVDTPDTTCDALNVRARFLTNPDAAFEFTVFRGACGTLPDGCTDTGYQEFSFSTNFLLGSGDGSSGECPCAAAATDGMNICADQTADYFVRVRRVAGAPVTCAGYELEFSNGAP